MSELQEIKKRLLAVEEDSKQTLVIVTEIKMGVCGSKQLKIEGLVQKVARHEKYIEGDKKQKWMVVGGVTVLMALWALFIAFLKDKFLKSG